VGFAILRVVLGVLLLAAAGLKLSDPSVDAFGGLELLSSPQWGMAAIEAEALLGLWLLAGVFPRLLWMAALTFFALLASASLYLGIEGQPSCGCFGAKLPVSPWYALGLDVVAVTALMWLRPPLGDRAEVPYSTILRRALLLVAGSVMVLTVGFGGLTWIYGSPYAVLTRFGAESISIEPGLTDIGNIQRLQTRSLTVVLRNQTDHPIRILGGTADCSCVTTDDLPVVVPARGTQPIQIKVIFRGQPAKFRRNFFLYTDDEDQPLAVARIQGRILEAVDP